MKKSIIFLLTCIQLLVAQNITHGPVTGAVTHNSARIYVRAEFLTSFELEVDDDYTFATPNVFNIIVDTLKDHTVITNVTGLTPNTYYYIQFKFAGMPDFRKGRFKTFPTPGEKTNFTLVTGSCQETANMRTFDRMNEIKPLLFLHLGDFTYPSYQLDSTYPASYNSMQLSWRKRYEEDRTKDLLFKIPIDYIHDDDDGFGTQQNYWITPAFNANIDTTYIYNYFDIDTIPIIGRYNHTLAYDEFFPHYPLIDTSQGLFHSYTIGNTEVFFLDTRSAASPNPNAFIYDSIANHWSFAPDTSHSILGNVQMNWLKQGLQNSTADWKILFCGVPFNKRLKILIALGITFQNAVFDISGTPGTGMQLASSYSQYWAGYPADQQELLDFTYINNIKDVIFVSGDTHHNVIDNGFNAGFPELNASGLSVEDLGLAKYMNDYLEGFGYPVIDSVWNVGGNGLAPDTNLLNAFGKIDVYKGDSLRLCVIDENGAPIACHTIVNSSIIGVPNQTGTVFTKVFPNPTSGMLNIHLDQHFKFTNNDQLYLVNTAGKMAKHISKKPNDSPHFTLNLDGLAKGIYYLIFDGDNGKFSKKIILQ